MTNDKIWRVVACFNENQEVKARIETVLNAGQELDMRADNEFTGRVATRIFQYEDQFVKLHTEIQSDVETLKDKAKSSKEREEKIGVHPENKYWFVAVSNEHSVIGNICPKLHAINAIFQNNDNVDALKTTDVLFKMYELSLNVLAKHKLYLDIALSNFGVDPETGKFYYLDDDFYTATEEDFSIFAESISTIIRGQQNFDLAIWDRLGEQLRDLTDHLFGPRFVSKISCLIGEPPLVRPEAIDCRNALLKGFIRKKIPKGSLNMPTVRASEWVVNIGRKQGQPKIALLSDIHANASALDAVLKNLEQFNIERVIVTGDVVGYGPDPSECVDKLRQIDNLDVVQGNHDYGAGKLSPEEIIDQFNGIPRDVLLWTKNVISDDQRAWLSNLPNEIRRDNYWAVHGSPKDPNRFFGYVYVMTFSDNLDVLEDQNVKRCFHGHTHVQGIYVRRGKQDFHLQDENVTLQPDDYALINAGSVGQPRGGKPGAEFALLSEDLRSVEFFRIKYDMDELIGRMRAAGLPATLENRIQKGR